MDLGFAMFPFTWEARGIKERLDRCLCNNRWKTRFADVTVFKFDHRLVLLKVACYNYAFGHNNLLDLWLIGWVNIL